MPAHNHLTRRRFLKQTGAAIAAASVLTARNRARAAGANERLNVGIIGCGGIVMNGHLPHLLRLRKENEIEIVAVCDVYETAAKQCAARIQEVGGQARVLRQHKEILALDTVDYVLNGTPEHQHAPITLDALDAGKHVYCEKPMTHTIEEAQRVLKKACDSGLKLQVGVQGMSDDSYSSAFEAIKEGKLGPVVAAQIEYVRNYKGNGPWRAHADRYNDPKPADLDWESWLGPATKRPYDPARYWDWRCYRDYSGGVATDLFVHRLTRILKACGLTFPEYVVGMGGIFLWDDGRDLPDNFEMIAQYPRHEGITPGMTVRILGTMGNAHRSDHCIRGHDATLIFTPEGWEILPESARGGRKPITTFKKTGAENQYLHHRNLHAAIRSNAPLHCPPELGLYGVVAVCMANQSWFEKKLMHWNARKGVVAST
jgi:predicted dehydrogenase